MKTRFGLWIMRLGRARSLALGCRLGTVAPSICILAFIISALTVLSASAATPVVAGPTPYPAPTATAAAPATPVPPPAAAPKLSPAELEKLLMPIALYPDPLLATILPASVYPLEVVQAARFLQDSNNIPKIDQQSWD